MIHMLSALSALDAVPALGFAAARAPSARTRGEITGTTSSTKGCPATNGGRTGGHHGTTQEG